MISLKNLGSNTLLILGILKLPPKLIIQWKLPENQTIITKLKDWN